MSHINEDKRNQLKKVLSIGALAGSLLVAPQIANATKKFTFNPQTKTIDWIQQDTGPGTDAPGGSDTQVQFNDGGYFGGDAEFIYDKTNNKLAINSTTTLGQAQLLVRAPLNAITNAAFDVQSNGGARWFTVGRNTAGRIEFNSQGGLTQCGGVADLGARMNIGSLSASKKPLAIRGVSGQTADLFDVQVSTGDTVFSVDAVGNTEWNAFKYVDATTGGTTNLFIGEDAGRYNTGNNNIGIGDRAYDGQSGLTIGNQNTAIGEQALAINTTGSTNVALGFWACQLNTTGSNNFALGSQALKSNQTGNNNIAIGTTALQLMSNGSNNVAIGLSALKGNVTSDSNTAIGNFAGFSSSGGANILIGYQAGYNLQTDNNMFIGTNAGLATTTGTENFFLGKSVGIVNVDGSTNVGIGNEALLANTSGSSNIAVGFRALLGNTTGLNMVALGKGALASTTTGQNSVAIGTDSLASDMSGGFNVAIGKDAGKTVTTGTGNVLIGYLNGGTSFNGSSCVYVGDRTGRAPGGTVTNNTYLGAQTGLAATGSSNVFVGFSAGYSETGSNKLYIENSTSATPLIYGEFDNDYVRVHGDLESDALKYLTATTGGTNNLFIGENIGASNTGIDNIGIGTSVLSANTTGSENMAFGRLAMQFNQTGDAGVAIGYKALQNNLSGNNNVAVGSLSLLNTTGSNNVAIGNNVLSSNTSGITNIGIGTNSLENATSNFNTAIGYAAARNLTSGTKMAAIGYEAGYTSGDNSIFFGFRAGKTVTGSGNVILGFETASTQTTISNQLWIDNSNTATPLIYGEFDNDILRVNGDLQSEQGRRVQTNRLTSTTTLDDTYHNVFCDSDGGAFTINLPVGENGRTYRIINTGSSGNDVTITPNGAELLTGVNASRTISDGSVVILTYETTEGWW